MRVAVSSKTRCILWARSAGRCQFPGCNVSLIGDLAAGNDTLNKGYIAHIVADKPGGPRGDGVRSALLADDPANLMLLCDPHHRLIDRDERDNYPESRLLEIKSEAESRVDAIAQIGVDKASHVVRYAATIGDNEGAVAFSKCREAMLPELYPASNTAIDLSLVNLNSADNETGYFETQIRNLRRQFAIKVSGLLETQGTSHLSVFALAPIPLLIELGRLISDITPAEVFQLHREPSGWNWAEDGQRLNLSEVEPLRGEGPVALKLELSSKISDDRLSAAIGADAQIWSIVAKDPHNDALRYREDLRHFRSTVRKTLAKIKNAHGEHAIINVFPAMPVSAAVEFGRVWMPKADLPLVVFDQSRRSGGFVERLRVGVD